MLHKFYTLHCISIIDSWINFDCHGSHQVLMQAWTLARCLRKSSRRSSSAKGLCFVICCIRMLLSLFGERSSLHPILRSTMFLFIHMGNQITEWLKNCFPDMYMFKIAYLIVNVNSQDTQISCSEQGIFTFRIKYIISILFGGTYKSFFFITLHL